MSTILKKLLSAALIGAAFSGAAHAGFSLGMTGAFKKQVVKLDAKVAREKAALLLLAQTPSVPTNLAAVALSSSQIHLSWTAATDDIGVTSYKIYRDGGASPIAAPALTGYTDPGCTAGTAYSYTVSACDAAGNCSGQSIAASTTTPLSSAGGEWILVPGSGALGTSDFYVMKYEAKNVSGEATSQADSLPWTNITLAVSSAACSAVGAHLLTIPETQTINRNIEAQAANWADGTIGSLVSAVGGLKRGNVGITDSASYNGLDPESGAGRDEKAKLVLSNASEIWDWSGNVEEWVYGAGALGTLGTPGGVAFDSTSGQWSSTISPDLSQERAVLGPSNGSWMVSHGVGSYLTGAAANKVLVRGGDSSIGTSAGIYTFRADAFPSDTSASIGFRCAK